MQEADRDESSGKFGLPLENEGYLDRDTHFNQQATYDY